LPLLKFQPSYITSRSRKQ